ncbi:bifunctional DNA-formamidopyrimidine glycosylase/DNA-(apurinic or apyrimidinic site) lyase [Candidatus Parcubacteria bacterium]|nr:MAG: bifunctional DNA-formamidopyrimidine glycosylase/DNA-(apurinic or apyrimidinic site) lyase [Candidatus Parcubacteria bacterium]
MPELPEVELTRRKLLPLISGERITAFHSAWPRNIIGASRIAMARELPGRAIRSVERRGKVLLVDLSGAPARQFAVHLCMSGRLAVEPAGSVRSPWARAWWTLGNGTELRFIDPRKFGRIWYGDPARLLAHAYLSSLGPDARTIGREAFIRRVAGRRAGIKALLLRQDTIAGIGNILADESLWRARIHPRAIAASLSAKTLGRLHRALLATIAASLRAGGSSLRDWAGPDGARGGFREHHRVYGRAGSHCPRCRCVLKRMIVAGRGTTACSRCQRNR